MSAQDLTTGFRAIDQTSDPEFYIRLLDEARRLDSIRACKHRLLHLLDTKEGHRILDVGCGAGEDAMAMARMVGSEGLVTGVDKSEIMIAEAKKRSAGSGLPVEWILCQAERLDFADNTFDGCRADRLLGHIEDPHKLLADMIRVTRPSGRVVVFDFDVDAFIFNIPDYELNRKVVHALCDSFCNGHIGRQLPALVRSSGLIDIFIIPYTLIYPLEMLMLGLEGVLENAQETGVLTYGEVSRWRHQLEEAEQQGSFFAAAPGFIVGGRKPFSGSMPFKYAAN
ncbi:MAG TPA: methyltransferase domain-containing protein [Blastocatellia bacterium]|nr:methyltransferase domain-containing protein [Blastocatellia bacterium]